MNEVLNVWSPFVFNKVNELMTSNNMPWYVCITDYYDEENAHSHKWQHIAYHKDVSDTFMAPWLTMAVGDAISRSGQDLDEIIRIRCSTTTITPENHVADPHVDTDFPHMTALFYLNDSDGDTVIYKDRYVIASRLDQTEYYKQYVKTPTVDYTVTPQANKMCWFNGLTYHSSNSPTTVAKRYIINVNYTVKTPNS